jgi:sugar phosphate isomerase/epimerase
VLLRADPPLHLTYCTNIHPAEGWAASEAMLRRIAPALKAQLSPDAPFGIGLRLGAREARELLAPGRLEEFRSFLDAGGLYVAIVNGFPYGPFHGEPVKTAVYAPDWRTEARVAYTLDLAAILARLLPDGVEGGISTVPLSYKPWMRDTTPDDRGQLTLNLVTVAERLVQIRRETGRVIHVAIEPEPDCVLETTDEAVAFFERSLWRDGARDLARRLGIDVREAQARLQDHIQLCFDCCHCAVEYEDPAAALARFRTAGIRIGRVQLSSALTVTLPGEAAQRVAIASRLHPFAESTYLHQVVERCDGTFRRFPDLAEALRSEEGRPSAAAAPGADTGQVREWRIHFHVPLFTAEYNGLGSSQDVVRAVLAEARRHPLTQHLEIETYTWQVLPEGLKLDLGASIAREYDWVLGEWKKMGPARSPTPEDRSANS